MDKTEARKIVMDAARKAAVIHGVRFPSPARPTQAYFDQANVFIQSYIEKNVPEETRIAAL